MPNSDESPSSYARARIEMDERWENARRRHRVLSVAGVILALAIIGCAWYFYPELKRQGAALARVADVQKVVDTLGGQMKQTDAKLTQWTNDQQELADRVTKLGQNMAARVEAARKQARQSAAEMFRIVQAQIDSQMQAVHRRLTSLESSSDNERMRVAELQRELTQVRGEMARQAGDLASVRRQMDEKEFNHERQLASLKQSEERNRLDVDAIENKLAVERLDFEVSKNHSQELAPGISLGVTSTDVLHRRVNGWVWVMPDRRTIWLRSHGSQEPVVFYGNKDGKKRELVITNVARNSVTGYLLLPKGAAEVAANHRQSE